MHQGVPCDLSKAKDRLGSDVEVERCSGGLDGGRGKDAQKGETENEIRKKAYGREERKDPEVFCMSLLEFSMKLCPLTTSRKVRRKGTHQASEAASF